MRTARAISLAAALATCAITALAVAEDSPEIAGEGALDAGEVAATGTLVDGPTEPAASPAVSPAMAAKGEAAFSKVYEVLQHPRCMNCHPVGNAPLQTDQSIPHAMNISRASNDAGLECAACHKEQNSEQVGVPGGPPGAPHWQLPAREMPLVFEGRSLVQLCAQLKDPARNGNKTLAQLLEHVSHDALVLWGWNPGGDRTVPPVPHAEFVAAFKIWVDSNGSCPSAYGVGSGSADL